MRVTVDRVPLIFRISAHGRKSDTVLLRQYGVRLDFRASRWVRVYWNVIMRFVVTRFSDGMIDAFWCVTRAIIEFDIILIL